MILKDFKLVGENENSYELKHPNGKKFSFHKKQMNEKAHALVKKLSAENNFAYGGEAGDVPMASPPMQPTQDDISQKFVFPGYNEPVMSPNSPLLDPMAGMNQPPSSPVPGSQNPNAEMAQPSQGQSQMPGTPAEGKMGIMDAAFNAQKGAEIEKMKAQQSQSSAESAALKQAEEKINQMQTQQQIVDGYKKRDNDLMKQFMDKKIDPDRYWNDKGTGSKLAAGIGMILGGVGAGMTGGRNLAADMIQAAISKDIDAQKSDKEKSMSLWKMNRDAMGNDLAADLATKNQLYTGLKYKLMQAQAGAGSQMAKANADAAIGLINKEQMMNNQQMYFLKQGMGQGTNQGGFAGTDPSVLVENNVKDPSLKAAAYKEIERAQIVNKQAPSIMQQFDEASKDVRPMSGGTIKSAIPGWTSPNVKAFHAEMGPTFQHLEGTVRQAAMDNMDKNLTPAFGDSDETIATKRAALKHYLTDSSAYPVTKGHNIDISKFQTTAPLVDSANAVINTFLKNNPSVRSEQEAVQILKAHGKL